jgi:hypothetical protein
MPALPSAGGEVEARDQQHLLFIYNRLLNVHQENENYDYMQRFREIIGDLPEPHSASSDNRNIMELKQEHLNALSYVLQESTSPESELAQFSVAAEAQQKFGLAAEAIEIMKQVFGASSRPIITLYPTIG